MKHMRSMAIEIIIRMSNYYYEQNVIQMQPGLVPYDFNFFPNEPRKGTGPNHFNQVFFYKEYRSKTYLSCTSDLTSLKSRN